MGYPALEIPGSIVWLAGPFFIMSRFRRFRFLVGVLSFWLLGTLYYIFISPPSWYGAEGADFCDTGWFLGMFYIGFIYTIFSAFRRFTERLTDDDTVHKKPG